ncbi:MAG: hypothetical protein PHW82_07640 [Bacteroidales bacterium]|nr:hypothetical protein [Bacteroidales bacterium]
MKKKEKYLKNILFASFVLALFFPIIAKSLNLFDETPLGGVSIPTEKPILTDSTWFNGSFQTQKEIYLNENIGLRKTLIRLNNQINFTLFNKTETDKIIIGKDNFLFENNYIYATTGNDYIGDESITKIKTKTQQVKQILADMSIDFLFVFAPGKATYFKEKVPNKYFTKGDNPKTNYSELIKVCNSQQINYIDFNSWFLQLKDTCSYPLFPKAGIHWSYYGMYLCADSLINKIENDIGKDIPKLLLNGIEISPEQRDPEYDLGNLMNLLYPIKTYELGYPSFSYQQENNYRPKVLVIGDSFYWNMYYSGIPTNVFNSLDFLYYNSQYYNDGSNIAKCEINTVDYLKFISEFEYIIVMQTDGGLNNFGLGFFDKLITSYNYGSIPPEINQYMDQILNDPEWKKHIEDKAKERGLSFDDMLFMDAQYMYENENKN